MLFEFRSSLLSVIISSMADWAGKTLGKVRIDNLVARGGMAEVYTGTHESFGLVTVKVMRGLLDRDSDQLARFKREAEVVEELRHPNIVQMFNMRWRMKLPASSWNISLGHHSQTTLNICMTASSVCPLALSGIF